DGRRHGWHGHGAAYAAVARGNGRRMGRTSNGGPVGHRRRPTPRPPSLVTCRPRSWFETRAIGRLSNQDPPVTGHRAHRSRRPPVDCGGVGGRGAGGGRGRGGPWPRPVRRPPRAPAGRPRSRRAPGPTAAPAVPAGSRPPPSPAPPSAAVPSPPRP